MESLPTTSPRLLPKIVKAGYGECLEREGEVRHILLDGRDTNGQIALSRITLKPGTVIPPHIHTREDEMFFITEGRFWFRLGNEEFELETGDFVFAPRHLAHAYRCLGDTPGQILVWEACAGFEACLRLQACLPILNSAVQTALAAEFGVYQSEAEGNITPSVLPRVVRAHENVDGVRAFGDCLHLLAPAETTRGQYVVALNETPSLSGAPLHIHERCDEIFTILEGRYEFCIGDARVQLGAGDTIFGPSGIPHSYRVISGDVGRCLVTALRGDFETYFRECATLFESGVSLDELMPQIHTVSSRYGITQV